MGIVSDVDPDEPVEVGRTHYLPTMQYYGTIRRQLNVELCMMPRLKQ